MGITSFTWLLACSNCGSASEILPRLFYDASNLLNRIFLILGIELEDQIFPGMVILYYKLNIVWIISMRFFLGRDYDGSVEDAEKEW